MVLLGFPDVDGILPTDDLDPEQVALLLLVSIAFEELALAHVINVEAEKLQAAVGSPLTPGGTANPALIATDLPELLEANRSAERMLRSVIKKEMLLQFKAEDAFDFLAGVTTTTPVTTAAACNCSLTPAFTTTVTNSVTTPIVPPITAGGLVILPNAGTTVTYTVDICDECTADDNNFVYNFNRPGSGPPPPILTAFSQIFSATTFESTLCILNAAGLEVGLSVSGRGNAVGTGTGSVTATNIRYTAIFDEVANTVTLILFDPVTGLIPIYSHVAQVVPVDLVVNPCTP
jgi:hypothetical protein